MKARTFTTKKAIKEEVEREYSKHYYEHEQQIVTDIAIQLLSTVLLTLDKSYGWKQKRLNDFIDQFKDLCSLMDNPSALTHRFNAKDNYSYIKNKFGIDLKELITFEVKT